MLLTALVAVEQQYLRVSSVYTYDVGKILTLRDAPRKKAQQLVVRGDGEGGCMVERWIARAVHDRSEDVLEAKKLIECEKRGKGAKRSTIHGETENFIVTGGNPSLILCMH